MHSCLFCGIRLQCCSVTCEDAVCYRGIQHHESEVAELLIHCVPLRRHSKGLVTAGVWKESAHPCMQNARPLFSSSWPRLKKSNVFVYWLNLWPASRELGLQSHRGCSVWVSLRDWALGARPRLVQVALEWREPLSHILPLPSLLHKHRSCRHMCCSNSNWQPAWGALRQHFPSSLCLLLHSTGVFIRWHTHYAAFHHLV